MINIPKVGKLSTASGLSLLAVVVLLGAIFFTVNSALQEQNQAGHASAGTNILLNPSFESGISPWSLYKGGSAAGTFTTTTATAEGGTYSALVNITGIDSSVWDIVLDQQSLPMQANQTYTVTFWAKASANRQILTDFAQTLSPYAVYSKTTFNLTTSWQQYSFTWTPTVAQSNSSLGFILGQSTGQVWIDNVNYYQGNAVQPTVAQPTPVPTVAPTKAPTAIPTAIPTLKPTPLPTTVNAGLAVVSPSCITQDYAGSGVHILWSETAVQNINISSASSFGTYYSEAVSGKTSTTAPSGFVLQGGTTALILEPNTTYYVRTWDGTVYSPSVSFTSPQCVSATSTPVPPTPSPTPSPTAVPTAQPTAIPQQTASPVPGDTTLSLMVGLHGIGTGGDSSNPNSDGNTNPLRPTRTVAVDIYNASNQLMVSQQGTITYDTASGKFRGNIDLGPNFMTGFYTVKVKSDQYLRAIIPGVQTITQGITNTLPLVTLVTGDINGDNAINIVDYNILIGCYSDLLPATDCNATNNVLADLTDDGHVNEFDYNLFLRELTNIGGQ